MAKLAIEHLTKTYDDLTVVNDASLQIEDGELLTIVGPSGCGKTTTLRMIAGLTDPTSGRIICDEETLYDGKSGKQPTEPENRDFGMVFQSYAVWPHKNVFENVAYPLRLRKLSNEEVKTRTDEALRMVQLTGLEKRMPYEMSGGQQQRIALARALVMKPKVLLLDEPLSNLDAALRNEMRGEIKEIQHNLGMTIINVTHDQVEAMTMSDKVAVMKEGKLVQFDTPYNIYEHPVNTFVAKFIGSANILPASRNLSDKPDQDGNMTIRVCGCYDMKVPYVEGSVACGFIACRAHQIAFEQQSSLTGKIRRKLYQGNQIEYYLQVEGQPDSADLIRILTPVEQNYEIREVVPFTIQKAVWLDE